MGGQKKSKKQLIELYSHFMPLLKKADLNFIAFFGTLLGIVRENDFMDGDDDIDVIISSTEIDKLRNLVKKENIKTGIKTNIKNNDLIALYHNGIGPFDIYIYYEHKNDILLKWDGNLLYSKNDIFPLKMINFRGFNLYIPKKSRKILRQTYGSDYMIPKNKKEYNWYDINQVRILKKDTHKRFNNLKKDSINIEISVLTLILIIFLCYLIFKFYKHN